MLKRLLAHPLTREMNIDDPQTTWLRREIIQKKAFLRKLYEEWYQSLSEALPPGSEPVLEVGSGAGFLTKFIPDLISSEVFFCPGVQVVLDAESLPLKDSSLRGIVMSGVLHHLPKPRSFFAEAARCVRPGGVIAMIEPWVSTWSRLVYGHLHHEPFDPESAEWEFPASGPLSGANSAMPWMIFERDRKKFEQEFPEWKIESITPFMPFRFLVAGGVSMRSLMPGAAFGFFRGLERLMKPVMKSWAMFVDIRLRRAEMPSRHGFDERMADWAWSLEAGMLLSSAGPAVEHGFSLQHNSH